MNFSHVNSTRIRRIQRIRRLFIFSLIAGALVFIGSPLVDLYQNLQIRRPAAVDSSAPTLPLMPDGFKAGMEVELTIQHLANLTDFFDFDDLQKTRNGKLPDGMDAKLLDDYLRNPAALADLSPEIRKQLSQGLRLESLLVRAPEAPKLKLILPGDSSHPRMQPVIPKSEVPAPIIQLGRTKEQNGILVPQNQDWETFHSRWNQLSRDERLKHVKWKHLAPKQRAQLIFRVSKEYTPMTHLDEIVRLRTDLPENVKSLFEKLVWFRDQDAVEFIHKIPVRSVRELRNDLLQLGRLAGVEAKILDFENSRIEGMSFHYHLSVPHANYSKNVARRLNDLMMLRRVELGIVSDLRNEGENHFVYDDNIDYKGLLRLHGRNRIEIRSHPMKLDDELRYVAEVMSLPETEALERLERDTRLILDNEDVLNRISKNEPLEFIRWKTWLREPYRSQAEALEGRIVANLLGSDPGFRKETNRYLRKKMILTPEIYGAISQSPLSDEWRRHLNYVLNELTRFDAPIPEGAWEILPLMKYDENSLYLARSIELAEHIPTRFWSEFPPALASLPVPYARQILNAISKKNPPDVFFDKLEPLLPKLSPLVRQAVPLRPIPRGSGSCRALFAI